MMTDVELAAARDALIAERNGAIKYQPALQDIQMGIGPLAAMKNEALVDVQAAVKSFADSADAAAMLALRLELANDPEKRGYKGKKPEEIQVLLTTERRIFADVNIPGRHSNNDYLAAKVRAEPFVEVTETQQVLVAVQPPPVGRIWQGIPYCRNIPSLDNIIEALK